MVRTTATFVGFPEQGSYQKEIVITLNFKRPNAMDSRII